MEVSPLTRPPLEELLARHGVDEELAAGVADIAGDALHDDDRLRELNRDAGHARPGLALTALLGAIIGRYLLRW